jgi:hypothetical protein
MVWVAVAEAVVIVAVVALLARLLSSQQRAHARREDLLVNQLLHLTGTTWQEPPVAESRHTRAAERGFDPPSWTAVPEQQPLE